MGSQVSIHSTGVLVGIKQHIRTARHKKTLSIIISFARSAIISKESIIVLTILRMMWITLSGSWKYIFAKIFTAYIGRVEKEHRKTYFFLYKEECF